MNQNTNQSKKRQAQKDQISHASIYVKCLEQANPQRQKVVAVARSWRGREREQGVNTNGDSISLGNDKTVLELDSGDA